MYVFTYTFVIAELAFFCDLQSCTIIPTEDYIRKRLNFLATTPGTSCCFFRRIPFHGRHSGYFNTRDNHEASDTWTRVQ